MQLGGSVESMSVAVAMIVAMLVKINQSSIEKRLFDNVASVAVDADTLCLVKTLWLSVVHNSICASVCERYSSFLQPPPVTEMSSAVNAVIAKYQLFA
jgi:hypothetical protein